MNEKGNLIGSRILTRRGDGAVVLKPVRAGHGGARWFYPMKNGRGVRRA